MTEWLTDKEKRLLLSALTREKKVCAEVDKGACREPYEESLVSVIESLEKKFYYDRLFKQKEAEIYSKALDDLEKKLMDRFTCDDLRTDWTNADIRETIHFEIEELKVGGTE